MVPSTTLDYTTTQSEIQFPGKQVEGSNTDCLWSLNKNEWMDGWLGFNGILSKQVAAIS